MSKTSKYQKKSSADYTARKKEAGYIRFFKWIKPATKPHLEELIEEIEKVEVGEI